MADTIYSSFLTQVRENPDAPAVVDKTRTATYAQLAKEAACIVERIPAGARFVGVVMDHGIEMIASILAILKSGAAYIPAEPDFPVERIGFMLTESGAGAVITQAAHADRLAGHPLIFVEPGSLSLEAAGPLPDDDAAFDDASAPDGLAYVLYTSGTTGTPKGVAVENRNVCSYIKAFQAEFAPGPSDRMLQHSVCSFDIFVEEIFSTLLSGATLVITPHELRDDLIRLIDFIDTHGVTIVDGFPYLMDAINSAPAQPHNVRLYISGGDVLHQNQVSRLVEQAAVYNTYGPSETTCCASYYRCDTGVPTEDGTYPIGFPVRGMSMELVDAALEPVEQGGIGEILISGPDVSRGYLGVHPEQANFITSADGTRSYLSGDMAYQAPDGAYVFLHRKDSQVMIRGRRVEAKEVENALLQDAAVHQAVVMPATDEAGFSYLIAYIVPTEKDLSLSKLKERLGRKLASFMIPEFFVRMNEIPLSSNGKPDEHHLPVVMKEGNRR